MDGVFNKKKKVIFFLQSGVGGSERVTVTIGKLLDVNKYEIVFCKVAKGALAEKNSIDYFIPKSSRTINIVAKNGADMVLSLADVLRKENPDIVFSSIFSINTKLLLISRFFKKTRFIIRCNNYLYTLSKIQQVLLKLTYKYADAIIAQTEEMKSELVNNVKLPDDKVFVMYNPIDVTTIEKAILEESPFDSYRDKIKFVASGRIHPVKGFDILIEAFAKVKKEISNAELFILGHYDEQSEFYKKLQIIIQNNGVSQSVHFEDFQTNPYKFVKNADCFVLSSRNEGLPNVLVEALYLGTPVAATTCIPVIYRIVSEGVNGFLAENENHIQLADAMMKAIKLGRVNSAYQGSSNEAFQKLFEDLLQRNLSQYIMGR